MGLMAEINKHSPPVTEHDMKMNGWRLKRKYIRWSKNNQLPINNSGYMMFLAFEIEDMKPTSKYVH